MTKRRVLLLCTGNSCRSQMAEGLFKDVGGDDHEVHSAGLHPCYVHPRAVEAMREISIDISKQKSKSLDQFVKKPFDLVITLCDHAREVCPIFPRAKESLHWSIKDPVGTSGEEEEIRAAFRAARDDIRSRIRALIEKGN